MSRSRYVYLSVLLASTFMSPAAAMDQTLTLPDYDFSLDTLTYTPTPKPAPLSNSFKTAGVCFLGYGDCDPDIDFEVDPVAQCKSEGFSVTSCSLPSYPTGVCPYNNAYFAKCVEDKPRACKEAGYTEISCSDGYVADNTQTCPYDTIYTKCKCDPCSGYDYTDEQANAQGYVPDGSCLSCSETKYKRKENPCSGYSVCECGGAVGASACYSGATQKFDSCKTCEPACDENCPDGYYEGISCSFGSSTKANGCNTKTCRKCSAPNPNPSSYGGCWKDCPEGYSYNETTHNYECNERTCENLISARYPSYVKGSSSQNDYTAGVTNMNKACYCYSIEDTTPLINSDILSPIDFADEFSACEYYCRPGAKLEDVTIEGNVTLTYKTPMNYSGYVPSSNITVNGNLKSYLSHVSGLTLNSGSSATFFPANCPEYKNVTMHADSLLNINSNCAVDTIDGLTMYSGATIEGINRIGSSITVFGTSETKPVKISAETISGDITSGYYADGTSGGLYIDFTASSPNFTDVTINRNTTGKITLNPSSSSCSALFTNPGPDTYITIKNPKAYGSCIYFNGRILATEGTNSAEITFKNGTSSYVLPRCCSEDADCPESVWNGSVKCVGKAKCYVASNRNKPTSSSTECTD